MKEEEYVLCVQIGSVRAALRVLGTVTPSMLTSERDRQRYRAACRALEDLDQSLSKQLKVDDEEAPPTP